MMTTPARSGNAWRKSSYSSQTENCVEVALDRDALVRDTKNRDGGHLPSLPPLGARSQRASNTTTDQPSGQRPPVPQAGGRSPCLHTFPGKCGWCTVTPCRNYARRFSRSCADQTGLSRRRVEESWLPTVVGRQGRSRGSACWLRHTSCSPGAGFVIGVDEVIARSSVAKATLYRHFPSKDDLVLAVLAHREQLWTIELVREGSHRRGTTPEQRLLAIFDVFDEWFRQPRDFEACSFINVLLEMGADHPVGQACIRYLNNIRRLVAGRAEQAGLLEPDSFARS
jgi:hypothetical protein